MQNSAHFKNEQRKQAQTDERIARLKQHAAAIPPMQLAAYLRYALSSAEAGRTKCVLHI